jgi:hypothetical protein
MGGPIGGGGFEPPPIVSTSPLRSIDIAGPPTPSDRVASLPPIQPAEPVSTYVEGPVAAGDPADDRDVEPSVPDEARSRIVAAVSVDDPVSAGPETVLHVRFAGAAAPDRLVSAMEAVKALLRDRPGGTRVVIHVPAPGGGTPLPMELRRGVAYDAELLAEVRRRLGEGLVDLQLAAG